MSGIPKKILEIHNHEVAQKIGNEKEEIVDEDDEVIEVRTDTKSSEYS